MGNAAVIHVRDPIGKAEDALIVSDDDEGAAVARGDAAQDIEHVLPGRMIERACRLVTNDQLRLVDKRASDCDPLLLAARQVGREMLGTFCKPDSLQCLTRFDDALPLTHPVQKERNHDVLSSRQLRNQVESLEYKAKRSPPECSLGRLIHALNILAEHNTSPTVMSEKAGNNRDQRGLSAAGGADEHDEFASGDLQIDTA